MANLTRKDMIEILREGGSVIYNGFHIKDLRNLPSEAELALGDPDRERAALAELQAQKAELDAQLLLLQQASTKVDADVVKPAPSKKAAAKEEKVEA